MQVPTTTNYKRDLYIRDNKIKYWLNGINIDLALISK